MIRDLSHIFSRIFGVPLLIQSTKLDAMLEGLNAARFHRGSLLGATAAAEPDPPPASEKPTYGYRLNHGVATVPVRGVLVRRAGQIDADSTPLQSYENLTRVLRNVRADPRARGILLDIDSPGGEAGGIFDFANEVRAISTGGKPVWAIANDDAMSAAYAIAAAAQRVWITDTGAAGSIGVVALHLDQSGHDDQRGLSYNYIFKGAHKVDANSHEPLTIEARAAIQGEIDRLYDKFTDSVAIHRRLQPAQLRATEARVYYGDTARTEGLVDDVGTFDQAHQALVETINPSSARGATRMDSENTGSTTAAANVVSLDAARSEATALAMAYAEEVAGLCELARHPELVGGFLKRGASVATVRDELIALNARNDQARSVETIDVSAAAAARTSGTIGSEIGKANAERFRAYQTPSRAAGI